MDSTDAEITELKGQPPPKLSSGARCARTRVYRIG